MKEFRSTEEQEEFSMIKEITNLMCNGQANYIIQNSLLRI